MICFTGYHRYYTGLKEFLLASSVARKIQVVPKEDQGITGNFEVTVHRNGQPPQVVHSKRHAGQGKASSLAERQAIVEQIQEIVNDDE